MTIEPIPDLPQDASVILEMQHISKSFGAVTALVDVSLKLRKGEVLALVGDNGAGKSTLIKTMSGFHTPDRGKMLFDGAEVRFNSPRDARARGIETVYQDLALIGDLSVYHNMFLGREQRRRFLGLNVLDNQRMRQLSRTYLDTLGISIPSVNSTVDIALRRPAAVHRGGTIDLFLADCADPRRAACGTRRPRECSRAWADPESPAPA